MNMDKLDKINFHDADMYNYVRDGNDISFELKDGWYEDTYYKIKLNNVRVEVMNNTEDLVGYVLEEFNNINKTDGINLYSGFGGRVEESEDERKYYLKLWIGHPHDFSIKTNDIICDYKFDGMDVLLCNDYDDTGRLFIKFIFSSIDIIELYPLLNKYSRNSSDNMNNLYKYKDKFGDKEFKFFSVYDFGFYLYYDLEYDGNNISIIYRNMLDLNDKICIKFLGISDKIDKEDLSCFIDNILNTGVKCCNFIRIISYDEGKYIVGFLKSKEEEFTFSCSDIEYEGGYLKSRGLLD